MKKILFDFITLQDNFINGGMLYTQTIFYEIANRKVVIYGLYDGNLPISETIKSIMTQYKINLINIRDENIYETINNLMIDTFFIGIAQRYNSFDLSGLKCRIVIACLDLFDMSLEYFKIKQSEPLKNFVKKHSVNNNGKTNRIKLITKLFLYPLVLLRRGILLLFKHYIVKRKNTVSRYANFKKLIQKSNVFVVTISEYSKYSVQYFLGNPQNNIGVFYAPISNSSFEGIDNFNRIPIKERKYFLLVSVNRDYKNAMLFLEQWEKFCLTTNYEYNCILVGKIKANLKNCIIIDEVKSEELAYLYKNAFALIYPSFAEGFGYPPIEAAMYATPSICSNVTSIPEICGDMPVYFSPFYPEDLFRAMIEMVENREVYVEKTKKRFLEINQKQLQDLEKIVDFILGESV